MKQQTTEQYEVFYRDVLIGILTVDLTNGNHRYVPNRDGVAKVEKTACLLRVMVEGTDGYSDPIPFFSNRLMNMKRSGLRQVNYQTDNFTIRQII